MLTILILPGKKSLCPKKFFQVIEFSINSKLISSNNENKIKFIISSAAGNLLGNNTQREDIISKVCKMFRLPKNLVIIDLEILFICS